jgi:hypothetical protein
LNHKLNIQRDTVEERKVSKPLSFQPTVMLCVGNKTKFLSFRVCAVFIYRINLEKYY